MTYVNVPHTNFPSKFTYHKMQDDGECHFAIRFNGYNTVAIINIRSKLGLCTKYISLYNALETDIIKLAYYSKL